MPEQQAYWTRMCISRPELDHVKEMPDINMCPYCQLANPTPPAGKEGVRTPKHTKWRPPPGIEVIDLEESSTEEEQDTGPDIPGQKIFEGRRFAALQREADCTVAQNSRLFQNKKDSAKKQAIQPAHNAGSAPVSQRSRSVLTATDAETRLFKVNVQLLTGRYTFDDEEDSTVKTFRWRPIGTSPTFLFLSCTIILIICARVPCPDAATGLPNSGRQTPLPAPRLLRRDTAFGLHSRKHRAVHSDLLDHEEWAASCRSINLEGHFSKSVPTQRSKGLARTI